MKMCPISGDTFEVDEYDRVLLDKLVVKIGEKKIDLPDPELAPSVRRRLKLMRRNEHHLYHTTCGLSGKKTISRIVPELWVPVYTNAAWASDDWECTDFGIERDAEGSVFEKINQLARSVPYQDMIGSLTNTTTNALYTNYTADITDSYMVFDAHTINKCYYLTKARRCDDCVDGHGLMDCRRCYECIDSQWLMKCGWAQQCSHCRDCWWMLDCHNCESCIWCVWQSHKQYCIFNQQATKEQFEEFREKCIASWRNIDETKQRKTLIAEDRDLPATVTNSSWIHESTDIEWSQDLRWCSEMSEAQDCFDVCSYWHKSFLMTNSAQVGRFSHHIWMSSTVWKSEHLLYCIDTKKCSHCFGCVNMKGKQYCIFNKQYTKEEYEEIVPQLIEQMQDDWVWWEWFPSTCCLFPYNDSKANEVYPIAKVIDSEWNVLVENLEWSGIVTVEDSQAFISKAVLDLWWEQKISLLWRMKDSEVNIPKETKTVESKDLASLQSDISLEELSRLVVLWERTGRPYRFVKGELLIYKALGVPLPRLHWEERGKRRVELRRR